MKHHHPDAFIDENTVSRVHPLDEIEPEISREDILRQGALKLLRAINAGMAHLEDVLHDPNVTLPKVRLAFWQFAFPIGAICCEGQTMTQKSIENGFKRATISKFATNFCRAQDIPPSEYMKAEESQGEYAKARIESILCNQRN